MRPNRKASARTLRRHSYIGGTVRKWFSLGALGIVLFFGLLGLLGKNGVLDLIRLKSMHRDLQRENLTLLEDQEELKSEMTRLRDPRYVEFLAKENLGLMRSNEVFIILDGSSPHSQIDKDPNFF